MSVHSWEAGKWSQPDNVALFYIQLRNIERAQINMIVNDQYIQIMNILLNQVLTFFRVNKTASLHLSACLVIGVHP